MFHITTYKGTTSNAHIYRTPTMPTKDTMNHIPQCITHILK